MSGNKMSGWNTEYWKQFSESDLRNTREYLTKGVEYDRCHGRRKDAEDHQQFINEIDTVLESRKQSK